MDPLLGKLLLSGGQYALGKAMAPTKRRFGETSYAKRLKEISKRGIIPDEEKRMVLGNVSRSAGSAASKAKSGYRGRLARLGMNDSIAAAGKMADIDSATGEKVARTGERVDLKNALSKQRALDEYAKEKTAYSEANREQAQAYNQMLNKNLMSDLSTLGGKYIQQLENKKAQESLDGVDISDPKQALGWALSQSDPQQAMDQLYKVGYSTNAFNRGDLGGQEVFNLLQNSDNPEQAIYQLYQLGLLPDSLKKQLE